MRVENRENNMYTKMPDRIDSYLIRIINRYFDNDMVNIENSREGIITEAINRFKEDGLDVNSVKIIKNGTIDIPLLATDTHKSIDVDISALNLKSAPNFLAFQSIDESGTNRFYPIPVTKVSGTSLSITSLIQASSTKTKLRVEINRAGAECIATTLKILYYILN